MKTELNTNSKNIGSILHLLGFGKWFFPFGHLLFPMGLWMMQTRKSSFIDQQAKQVLNFQLSLTLYWMAVMILSAVCLLIGLAYIGPDLIRAIELDHKLNADHFNSLTILTVIGIVATIFVLLLFVMDIYCTVKASVYAQKGTAYTYPLSIPFFGSIKEDNPSSSHKNTSS